MGTGGGGHPQRDRRGLGSLPRLLQHLKKPLASCPLLPLIHSVPKRSSEPIRVWGTSPWGEASLSSFSFAVLSLGLLPSRSSFSYLTSSSRQPATQSRAFYHTQPSSGSSSSQYSGWGSGFRAQGRSCILASGADTLLPCRETAGLIFLCNHWCFASYPIAHKGQEDEIRH